MFCLRVNAAAGPADQRLHGYLPPTKNGVEPKRPSRPINITSLVRLSTTVPNTIVLGKMRLMIPCRALTCSHLQCFDATLYIQMNEKKPTWVCPVCDKKAPYEHLIIDGVLNLHHQASPVSRTPSMPAMDTSYIPPVPPLIQDYRPYYHTPNDLSASEDHELLLNRFLPYSTSSSASQLFLDQSGTPAAPSLTAPTNGLSNMGGSSLISSSSLRETHSTHSSSHAASHPSHTHPGVVASRSSAEAAVAAIYGGIPDVISLD
ncbi:hypothetical protein XENOCAPTIV_015631 [Xenoophorus captivus]|uniref:SP-RING-type domain-containing protein n=1 Tax=Xenoophorus captivus TaxID=1517983 RepID=A0ABV0QVN5_9TELE